MMYNNIDFNNKTILITGGAGFIGSNLAFYLQENFPNSKVIVFDCFRNNEIFHNGNITHFGHYNKKTDFKKVKKGRNINKDTKSTQQNDRTTKRDEKESQEPNKKNTAPPPPKKKKTYSHKKKTPKNLKNYPKETQKFFFFFI